MNEPGTPGKDPMNCADFQSRLAEWLAGDADEAGIAALETHLNSCAQCQNLLESATEGDQTLRSAIAEPQAAERVARRAAKEIQAKRTPAAVDPVPSFPWRAWLIPLLTAAAGFVAAIFILPRSNTTAPAPQAGPPMVQPRVTPDPPPIVAHLVAATGRVERYDDQKKDWVAIDPIKYFQCPSDSRVRTAPDVRCELKTGDGSVIRLNDKTEVKLLGSSSIELHQGQLWCRSPQEATLEVRVASTTASPDPKAPQPTMWSAGTASMVTCTEQAKQVQVVSAEGEINLRTAAGNERLGPGQVAEISGGQVVMPGNRVDPLLATRWMQPLLVSRGADNAELQQRVDTLLAQIGRAKIATFYEQEIRSLGEHAVLPLVRFIQSPLAAEDPRRRSDAMRIAADLAPVWLIPDLIDLLEDREGYVRQLAAATLFRLTALSMNLSPTDWRREPDEAQATAVKDWRNWWEAHRDQFPRPQVRITRE